METLSTSWQNAIQQLAKESDPENLVHLLTQAETAIFCRLQELEGKNTTEREHLASAIKVLRAVQVNRLGYPLVEGETFTQQSG